MLNEKKVVPKLRQELKVTSDDIKIYYTGKFQDFTARYMINYFSLSTGNTGDYYQSSVPYTQYQSNPYNDPQWAAAVRYGSGAVLSKYI